jgi:hypothetical protein
MADLRALRDREAIGGLCEGPGHGFSNVNDAVLSHKAIALAGVFKGSSDNRFLNEPSADVWSHEAAACEKFAPAPRLARHPQAIAKTVNRACGQAFISAAVNSAELRSVNANDVLCLLCKRGFTGDPVGFEIIQNPLRDRGEIAVEPLQPGIFATFDDASSADDIAAIAANIDPSA